jgi:hypothetical protein
MSGEGRQRCPNHIKVMNDVPPALRVQLGLVGFFAFSDKINAEKLMRFSFWTLEDTQEFDRHHHETVTDLLREFWNAL